MSSISLAIIILFLVTNRVAVVQDMQIVDDRPLSNTTQSYMIGDLQLDLDARTSSILWTIVTCRFHSTSVDRPVPNNARVSEQCQPPTTALAVYVADNSKPVFSYIPSELAGETQDAQDHFSFETKHRAHRYDKLSPSTQLTISSDHYFIDTLAFVVDPTTNRSVHIAMLAVAGTIQDFIVRSHDTPATNTFTYNPGDGPVNVEVESHILRVEIKPSTIALANAISLFLINWLTTIGSIYITILVTSGRLERDNVVAAGPFSALVAIPTVRSFYASSPPLASPVESAGFLVQIAAVVSCSVILLKAVTDRTAA